MLSNQGTTLTSLSKSWDPWLKQYSCKRVSEKLAVDCKTSGILHWLMDMFGRR